MKKIFLSGLFIATTFFVFGQDINSIINAKEVERIERVLSADDMMGRRAFTPGIDKAAAFIEDEFKKTGLQTAAGSNGYLQEFAMVRPKFISASATLDGVAIDQKSVIVVTCQPQLKVDQNSGYEKITIAADANLQTEARKLTGGKKNTIAFVNKSQANNFANLTRLKSNIFKTATNVIFILADAQPTSFSVEAVHEIAEQKLTNVVGILPGKSKKDEYVIFSGHYDHLGINAARAVNGDSIFNGANDDAAGTTAVMMLAKYFKAVNNNERTLVFVAFTAEEMGGFGSRYFSSQYAPEKVMAMFNIEMIGTESKWGKNSAFITGFEKTDMGAILQKNLEGSGFTFQPDPYTEQNLFYRSDNATLARLGVPAHTISTAKMESEPHYHKPSDHIETLDMNNMAEIIKSIAISAKTIISGKDTPTRVKVEE
jgi:hypothetical protein